MNSKELHYEEALEYARAIMKWSNKLFNEYDIVHGALVEHGSLTKENLKSVGFSGREDKRHSEYYERLTQTKICTGCPEEGPQPVGAFYFSYKKRYKRGQLSNLCRKCADKASVIRYKKLKDTESYKSSRKKAAKKYYNKKKKNPAWLEEKRKRNREYMKTYKRSAKKST